MRRSLILALSLLAGAATLGVLQFARPAVQDMAAAPRIETVRVLTFARDLTRGSRLVGGDLAWQDQLQSAVPADAVLWGGDDAAPPTELIGRVLRRDALAGEVLRPGALVQDGAGLMALTLAPGKRAVGLDVTAQRLAGGFIQPGDRVDVIHTAAGDFDHDGQVGSFSQTILENIRVLAVGNDVAGRIDPLAPAEGEDPPEPPPPPSTVTLEMADDEAEILFSALTSGQISLALRALADQGEPGIRSTIGFERARLRPAAPAPAASSSEEPAAPTPALQPVEPPRIRMIQGGVERQVEVPAAEVGP